MTDDPAEVAAQQAARREIRAQAEAALRAYRATLEPLGPALLAAAEAFDRAQAAGREAQALIDRLARVEGREPVNVETWPTETAFRGQLAVLGLRLGAVIARPALATVENLLEKLGR